MTSTAAQRRPDAERGASMSLVAVLLMPCLILAGGLAVDGAQQARARRQAHTVAAQAARAGCDEGSAAELAGQPADGRARAEQVLAAASPDGATLSSAVDLEAGRLTVTVSATRRTIVLSAIGLDAVHGEARVGCRLMAR